MPRRLTVRVRHRELFFQAASADERAEWLAEMSSLIGPCSLNAAALCAADVRPSAVSANAAGASEALVMVGAYQTGPTVGVGGYAEVKIGHHRETRNKV